MPHELLPPSFVSVAFMYAVLSLCIIAAELLAVTFHVVAFILVNVIVIITVVVPGTDGCVAVTLNLDADAPTLHVVVAPALIPVRVAAAAIVMLKEVSVTFASDVFMYPVTVVGADVVIDAVNDANPLNADTDAVPPVVWPVRFVMRVVASHPIDAFSVINVKL
jgi:hypothetical protein